MSNDVVHGMDKDREPKVNHVEMLLRKFENWKSPQVVYAYLKETSLSVIEAQPILAQVCGHLLDSGDFMSAQILVESGLLVLNSNLKSAAENLLVQSIKNDIFFDWGRFSQTFGLKKTGKVKEVAAAAMLKALEMGQLMKADSISLFIGVVGVDVTKSAATGVRRLIHQHDFVAAKSLAVKYKIELAELEPDFKVIAIELLNKKNVDLFIKLREAFDFNLDLHGHEASVAQCVDFFIGNVNNPYAVTEQSLNGLKKFIDVCGVGLTLKQKLRVLDVVRADQDGRKGFKKFLNIFEIDSDVQEKGRFEKLIHNVVNRISYGLGSYDIRYFLDEEAEKMNMHCTYRDILKGVFEVLEIYVQGHPDALKACTEIARILPKQKIRALKKTVIEVIALRMNFGNMRRAADSRMNLDKDLLLVVREVFDISDKDMALLLTGPLTEVFQRGELNDLEVLMDVFGVNLSKEEIKSVAVTDCLNKIVHGDLPAALGIAQKYQFRLEDIPDRDALKAAAEKGFKSILYYAYCKGLDSADNFLRTFDIPLEDQNRAVNEQLKHDLTTTHPDGLRWATIVAKRFLGRAGFVLESDTNLKIRDYLVGSFTRFNEDGYKAVCEKIKVFKLDNLLPEMVAQAAINALNDGKEDVAYVAKVCKENGVLEKPEVITAATSLLVRYLESGDMDNALKMQNGFGIKCDSNVQELAVDVLKGQAVKVVIDLLAKSTSFGVKGALGMGVVEVKVGEIFDGFKKVPEVA